MSANFLDTCGFFSGVDLHLYFPGPAPLPPVPNIHQVGQIHLIGRFWRRTSTVKTAGWSLLQNNWSMLVVPHIPLPIPPNPVAEGANLACIILTGTSAPQMSAHSVTGQGEALLTAMLGAFGANRDCGLSPIPVNVDVNPSTVKTSPSMGDYVAGGIGIILGSLYNAGTGMLVIPNAFNYAIAILMNLSDIAGFPFLDPFTVLNWLIGKIQGLVQGWID